MMTVRCSALILPFALLTVTGVKAQSVAGTYTWKFPLWMNADGSDAGGGTGTARLRIEVKGDSIAGTYATSSGSRLSPIREGRGTFKGNAVEFQMKFQVRRRVNSAEQTIDVVETLHATVKGNVIRGTISSHVPSGASTPPARTFVGERGRT